jgi:8-oxo-dGTP diphosphatase
VVDSRGGCDDLVVLHVAAAAVIREGRLLLVSKDAAPDVFYLPGGKPEPNEEADDCVRREVEEELGAQLITLEFLETVEAPAALEGVPMAMDVFVGTLDREPFAAREIAELAWYRVGEPFAGRLAPAIAGGVLPSLRARSLL